VIGLVQAVQLLMADWHRARASFLLPRRPPDFTEYLHSRRADGFEPAKRLLRAEGLPPADVSVRQLTDRTGSGGSDVDLLEYLEDCLNQQWDQDLDYSDLPSEVERYWAIQNRLRRLFGLREIDGAGLADALRQFNR